MSTHETLEGLIAIISDPKKYQDRINDMAQRERKLAETQQAVERLRQQALADRKVGEDHHAKAEALHREVSSDLLPRVETAKQAAAAQAERDKKLTAMETKLDERERSLDSIKSKLDKREQAVVNSERAITLRTQELDAMQKRLETKLNKLHELAG